MSRLYNMSEVVKMNQSKSKTGGKKWLKCVFFPTKSFKGSTIFYVHNPISIYFIACN